jgi:predicted RNA-binding protein YlqC (UPF0109 family)
MQNGSAGSHVEVLEIVSTTTILLRAVVHSLVKKTADVDIVCAAEGNLIHVTISVAPEDLHRVVGVQGRTIRSIRTVLQAVSAKLHHRFELVVQKQEASS